MIILLSPSKSMNPKSMPEFAHASSPQYLPKAEELAKSVNHLGDKFAKTLGISEKLADLNRQRYKDWTIDAHETEGVPAAFLYSGDAYNGLATQELAEHDLEFAQRHLRILSGLYGILRPLDSILPYRLEMGTKLKGKWGSGLYSYWGESLTQSIEEVYPSFILNCASEEYFKAVKPYLSQHLRVITPRFLHDSGDGPKSKMNFVKYTRGLMARWAIANYIHDPEAVNNFDYEGYKYVPDLSKPDQPAFLAPKNFTLLGRFTKD